MTPQKEYMTIPSTRKWKDISNRFYEIGIYPIVVCYERNACKIQQLPYSVSRNYNYKYYHSTILIAVCDIDSVFTLTKFAERNSDCGI